jgi:outer membrane receptor protein involved in Fe transport
MTIRSRGLPRALLFVATATSALTAFNVAHADTAAATTTADTTAGAAETSTAVQGLVVTAAQTTRSSVLIKGSETQKLLPGISPLKAIETLPGVNFETADPWGNNEQNESLFVHGFSTQQLGYTMDNVPLGDQQYGNYNGLSVSRALSSENVDHVTLSSGAGSLGVASTSNLGGAIETFSIDPAQTFGFDVHETLGSYETNRTFLRLNTGEIGGDNTAFASYVRQDARAWDFDGHQTDDQANLKFVHEDSRSRLTFYLDWQSKVEPNEDAVNFGNQQTATSTYFPYTRPFIYPNVAGCVSYLTGPGTPPPALGNNFSNCFSAAQRMDLLGYVKYDYKITPNITWSNQAYYHYDYGRGIVAGPVNQAGLPTLFATYFPSLIVGSPTSTQSLTNLSNLFGGTGYEVRTTEYRINRFGEISTLDWQLGDHQIEAGLWYEHNEPAQHRVWYPFGAANDDLSPYTIPHNPPIFVQYAAQFYVDDVQLHLQDQWRIFPSLLLQAGFKSSLQTADGTFPIEQKNLPTATVPVVYPQGQLTSDNWFLPQVGAVWNATDHEQVFFNIQENMRQFIPYGAGSNFFGFSPWSLGTQAAFNLFKQTVHPETSWTYELGVRTQRPIDLGVLTSIDGQANVYHVDFRDRLLNVAPYNFINPAPAILVNVGGVTTNGVDVAATLNFGEHFHIYDAISYNKSTYDSSYDSGTTNGGATPVVVPTAGKWVPDTPDWLEKFIVSTNFGPFEAQLNGDYVGRRYATYLNDLSVPATFLLGLEASYRFDLPQTGWVKGAKISVNVINLTDAKGVSTLVVTSTSGGYQAYPIAPTMGFVTLEASF